MTSGRVGGLAESARPDRNGDISVVLVGDLIFSPPLDQSWREEVERLDPAVRDLLKADIVVANLEGSFCDEIPPDLRGKNPFAQYAPTASGEALKDLGIGAVCLANNHILDCGEKGLADTLTRLDSLGIGAFGAGLNLEQATRPLVLTRNGIRIGFVGFGCWQSPARNRPGCIPFETPDSERIIREARSACDHLIVLFHSGIEALGYPLSDTMRAAHAAIDAGAAAVIGSHPHTFQGVEWYKGKPIAYSLGNFIMPMAADPGFYETWRSRTLLTRIGMTVEKQTIQRALVFRMRLGPSGVIDANATCIRIGETGMPRLPDDQELASDQARLEELSEVFQHPEADAWALRDRAERAMRRNWVKRMRVAEILKKIHRIRWRHVRSLWRAVRGR